MSVAEKTATMGIRRCLAVALGLALGGGWLQAADNDLAARIHFAGTAHILADPDAGRLKEIGALPESGVLWEQIVGKLATAPFRAMNLHSPPRTNDHAAEMRPLAEDFLRSESYCVVRATTNFWPELALAVKLENARADAWSKTLSAVLKDWTGIAVNDIEVEGLKGWELRKHHNPDRFRFFRTGDWIVFGWGDGELTLQPALVKEIKSRKRPVAEDKEDWLNAWVDWPKLSRGRGGELPFKLSEMELKVETRKYFLRPELKLHFAEPLGMNIEPWKFPTNLVHDPASAMTLVRGFGPLLAKIPELGGLSSEPLPNEAIVWAATQVPFLTTGVAPVKNSKNYLMQIAPGLVTLINSYQTARDYAGRAELTTNLSIGIRGLPVFSPFLKATNDSGVDYLMAGVFAPPVTISPFPWHELEQVIGPANVIYYEREMNGERMFQWRSLSQLYYMITVRNLPRIDTPAQNWLVAIKPRLDDCRTVGTLSAQDEITVIRNAPLGLTGFELTCLALWLDSPGFPLQHDVAMVTPINSNLIVPKK